MALFIIMAIVLAGTFFIEGQSDRSSMKVELVPVRNDNLSNFWRKTDHQG